MMMKRLALTLAVLLSLAAPLSAQVTRHQLDSLRADLIRERGFVRSSETTLTRAIARVDSMLARLGGTPVPPPPPPVDTVPTPPSPPVQPPANQFTPRWFSDDRTTPVGTTGSRDGTKWAGVTGLLNGTIIDAPAGLPMAHLRRIAGGPDRDGAHIITAQAIPEMAVNSTRNWRWYYVAQMPCTGASQGQHPIQDGGAVSQSNWYMGTTHCVNGLTDTQWGVQFNFGGNSSPNFRWYYGTISAQNNAVFTPLTKGVPYRVEIQLVRVSATQFRAHIWVSDGITGALVAGDADFRSEGNAPLSTAPLLNFNVVANTGTLVAGLNGIANNTVWPIHHNDQGAFAIVDGVPEGSQIGAYGRVVGEVPR